MIDVIAEVLGELTSRIGCDAERSVLVAEVLGLVENKIKPTEAVSSRKDELEFPMGKPPPGH